MENREALLNAGFENYSNRHLVIKTENTNIFVNPKDLHTEVYIKGSQLPTIIKKLKDLEDVKAFCYGHLGYYLDFTEKPKYDWETAKKYYGQNQRDSISNAIYWIGQMYNQGTITQAESLSMIAKIKLNIIIRQINKDYPKDKNKGFGYISYTSDKIMYSDSCILKNALGINTESPEGAQILLDQNPQLLQNLFKIETDATGED
jgi:hypothetical protein